MAAKTIAAMVKRLRGANKGKWVKTYFPNQQRFKAAMARDASRIKPIESQASHISRPGVKSKTDGQFNTEMKFAKSQEKEYVTAVQKYSKQLETIGTKGTLAGQTMKKLENAKVRLKASEQRIKELSKDKLPKDLLLKDKIIKKIGSIEKRLENIEGRMSKQKGIARGREKASPMAKEKAKIYLNSAKRKVDIEKADKLREQMAELYKRIK